MKYAYALLQIYALCFETPLFTTANQTTVMIYYPFSCCVASKSQCWTIRCIFKTLIAEIYICPCSLHTFHVLAHQDAILCRFLGSGTISLIVLSVVLTVFTTSL